MSIRTLVRVLAATSLATGLAVSSTGFAQARTLDHNDAAHDVRSFDLDSDSGVSRAEPTVADGDIVHVHVTHGMYGVRLRIRFAELTRHDLITGDILRLRTSEGLGRYVELIAGEGMAQGQTRMYTPGGDVVHCRMQHSIDYADNVIKLSFPRRCISRPHWIRVGVGAVRISDDADDSKVYEDDGFKDNKVGNSVYLSRRIVRG